MDHNNELLDALRKQQLAEDSNGIPTLSNGITIDAAHDFLPDHMTNIRSIIASLKANKSFLETAKDSLDEANQMTLLKNMKNKPAGLENATSINEAILMIDEFILLNQGGLNFLGSSGSNGYKIVHPDQDQLIERARATIQEK